MLEGHADAEAEAEQGDVDASRTSGEAISAARTRGPVQPEVVMAEMDQPAATKAVT